MVTCYKLGLEYLISRHYSKSILDARHISCTNVNAAESNGKLPPRTCPGCSVPEPHRSNDRALVSASPASKAEY